MSAVEVAPSAEDRSSPVSVGKDFLAGVMFLLRGLKMYARSPRLMLLGLIPAFISLVLLVATLVTLAYFVSDLAELVTWFADDWSSGWRQAIRIAAGVAIMGGAVLLSFVGFTALTLVIGEPFYEAISKNVEDRLGGLPGEVDIRSGGRCPAASPTRCSCCCSPPCSASRCSSPASSPLSARPWCP
ncbi:EI24 domain-containing protein [Luedemannella flava]